MSLVRRSSEEIKKDIVDQLCWDSRINSPDIKVEVTEKKVVLTGYVSSYTAKLAAKTDCLIVPGVSFVVNNLEIKYPAGIKHPTDEEIKDNVDNSLIWNPNINSSNIDVSVNKGIVTLKGSVVSYWQKILAEELISDKVGVLDTVNKLSVVPSESIIDDSIADAITTSLDRKPGIDIDSIDVKVEAGVATLSGKIHDYNAYYDAFDSARYTVGVVNVINNLNLE